VEYVITHEIDEENTEQNLSQRQLVQMITEAGRDPVERDPLYNIIEREDSRMLLSLPMLAS
jgi:aminodeoxyfutalosine synthase